MITQDKKQYINYATRGGLYLYDNKCIYKYDNLSKEYLTDWLMFFDICREDPKDLTEDIIKAIQEGLCPSKARYLSEELCNYDLKYKPKTIWYLKIGKEFNNTYIKKSKDKEPISLREDISLSETYLYKTYHQDLQTKVYLFDHMYTAWDFIFQQI